MRTKTYSLLLTSAVAIGLLATVTFAFSVVSAVHGQEQRSNTIGVEAERLETDVNTIPAETNVCDGVTCADGSCAATVDECSAVAPISDSVCNGFVCDNGECAASEAMCGVLEEEVPVGAADSVCNGFVCDSGECVSSEAMCGVLEEVPASAADSVCNGFVCDDGECAASEAMCSVIADTPATVADDAEVSEGVEKRANYNNTRSNRSTFRDADSDGDGLDDGTERAQNHNSSRSNRTEGVAAPDFNDPDDDGDSLPTEAAGRDIDKASPLLFKVAGGGSGDLDGDGFDDAVVLEGIDGEVVADEETGEERLRQVTVNGAEVRQWSEEQREAFSQIRNSSDAKAPQYAGAQVAEAVLENDRIESVELDDNQSRMEYRAQLRWLGFIPSERVVTATTEANGEVSIDYPWYSFLASKPDTNTIRTTMIEMLMTLSADPI